MVRTRKGLTERHQKIIAYLNERMSTGYPPSICEIGVAVGITSTSVVTYYLKQLAEIGLIERDARFSRAVRLTVPVSRELVKDPGDYEFSSYNNYSRARRTTIQLVIDPIPEHIGDKK